MHYPILRSLALFAAVCSCHVHAQTPPVAPVQEAELRTCLQLEQQGLSRFNALEQRANALRATEKQLSDKRIALQSQKKRLDASKPDATAIAQFNESINSFNQQTDQLNTEVSKFEVESSTYQDWMNNTLKPACNTLTTRPVSNTTTYFACGFDKQGEFAELPHCKTLPELDKLKACIQKAGSKAKALETCNGS
jgi:hypothetical protein